MGAARRTVRRTIAVLGVVASGGVAVAAPPPGFVATSVGDANRLDGVAMLPSGAAQAFATHLPTLLEGPEALRSLQATIRRGDGAWSPATPLTAGTALKVIATSPSGTRALAVAWRTAGRSTTLDVAVGTGGSWGAVTSIVVSPDVAFSDPIALGNIAGAINDRGRGVLVWSAGGVLAGITGGSANWSPRIRLYRGDRRPGRPAVAINARGDAVAAAWGSRGQERQMLVVGYRRDRGRWTAPRTVPYLSDRPYFQEPAAALGDDGRAAVAWSDRARVWVASGAVTTSRWAPPRALSPVTNGVYGVTVTGDRAGRVLVTWTNGESRIQMRTRLVSGVWAAVRSTAALGAVGRLNQRFAVALNGRGAGVMAGESMRTSGEDQIAAGLSVRLVARPGRSWEFGRIVRVEHPGSPAVAGLRSDINDAGDVVVGWTIAGPTNSPDAVEVTTGRL